MAIALYDYCLLPIEISNRNVFHIIHLLREMFSRKECMSKHVKK